MSKLTLAACLLLLTAPAFAAQDSHDHQKGAPGGGEKTATHCPIMAGAAAPAGPSAPGKAAPKDKARGMAMMKDSMCPQGPATKAPSPPAPRPPAAPGEHDHSDPKAAGHNGQVK